MQCQIDDCGCVFVGVIKAIYGVLENKYDESIKLHFKFIFLNSIFFECLKYSDEVIFMKHKNIEIYR